MSLVTLACEAMGCRCEMALYGSDPAFLRSAGEEALAEIERLDAQLSLFRPDSEVAGINAHAFLAPVQVEPRLFQLLLLVRHLSEATEGAFDPTVGPLLRLWGFRGGEAAVPSDAALTQVQAGVGMAHIALDEDTCGVRFLREGMELDLGAIGKGYALERAAEVLAELEVAHALLHAGTSSVYALGAHPDGDGWPVAIADPDDPERHLVVLRLRDEALSVSGLHGRRVSAGDICWGHILDPRTGRPAAGPRLAAVTHPSPTVAEALSTALLVAGEEWLPVAQSRWPEAQVRLWGERPGVKLSRGRILPNPLVPPSLAPKPHAGP